MKRLPTVIYRIYDTRSKSYLSWNQKSSWSSAAWVHYRLNDLNKGRDKLSHLEIHTFPVETPTTQPATEFLRVQQELEKKKTEKSDRQAAARQHRLLQARREEIEREISRLEQELKTVDRNP